MDEVWGWKDRDHIKGRKLTHTILWTLASTVIAIRATRAMDNSTTALMVIDENGAGNQGDIVKC
jgi:hypothetical protein